MVVVDVRGDTTDLRWRQAMSLGFGIIGIFLIYHVKWEKLGKGKHKGQ